MDIMQAAEGLKQHFEAFVASATEKLEQELPVIGALAQQAAANPAVVALMNAEHLPEVPEYLQALADEIGKIDAALGAAKAKAAAEATAAAAAAQQPAEQPPAEPAAPA